VIVARRKSGAGSAGLRNNGESGAHHAAKGAFSDAREVLGENAAIGKLRGVIGPNYANKPIFARFFRTGQGDRSDRNDQERLERRVEHRDALRTDEKLDGSSGRVLGSVLPAVDDD
jgi:hypothetical protein